MSRYPVPWEIKDVLLVLLVWIGISWLFSQFSEVILNCLNGGLLGITDSLIIIMALATLIQAFILIGLVFYLVRIRYRLSWDYLGLEKASASLKNIIIGIGGGISLVFLVAIAAAILESIIPQPIQPQPFVDIFLKIENWKELSIALMVVIVLAPINEEIFFRGFLYPYLRDRLGVRLGQLGSAMVFGALHLDPFRFVPLTMGGIGLAVIYQRTKSLYASILAHAVWNTVMILILLLSLKSWV